MDDIIIIGAGPIGLYSAILASLHSLKGRIIESQESVGGQLSSLYPEKDIIDLPGFKKITAQGYIDTLFDQYSSKENRLDLHLEESVNSFEKVDDHYLVKTSKGQYETKTILITTGMGNFTPRKTGLASEDEFSNILYSVKDMSIFKDKKVCVLGGGDSAVDWALMIERVASEISIVHRRNEFRAQSNSVEELKASKANIFTPYVPNGLIGNGDKLEKIEIKNVETSEIKEIGIDYLVVNYGMIPSQNSFPIEKKGTNIVVNREYMTSLENVFAIGNIISYEGKVKNITCGLGEAVVAITKIDQIINPTKNIPVHF